MKKLLSVAVVLAGCTGLMMQPALAKHRHHGSVKSGATQSMKSDSTQPMTTGTGGGNAAMTGNNGNSPGGSNSAANIKGGNNGLGK